MISLLLIKEYWKKCHSFHKNIKKHKWIKTGIMAAENSALLSLKQEKKNNILNRKQLF